MHLVPLFSTCPHVTTTGLLGFPSHCSVSSPLLRALSVIETAIFTNHCCCSPYGIRLSSTLVWPNEYELIALKVVARGRTHREITCHTLRLSEHYYHSSSTPGRRSRIFVGVQSKEIGKGYHYYGSEVGRLCSTFCILSRFTTMMYTGVAEGLYLGGHPCLQRCTRLQPYRLHRSEWLASAPRPKPRCG